MGTRITCTDLDNGESDSAEITDDHMIVCDGRSYIASVVAYANGTHVVTIKKAATVEEARRTQTDITRYFGRVTA